MSWRRRLWHSFIRARFPFKRVLVKAYLRALERKRSLDAEPDRTDASGPIPPARMRVLVNGIPDLDWFVSSGRAQTNHLRALLAEVSRPLQEMDAILEFGCGCGRMTRWWADLHGPRVYACDYNSELVGWCRDNLPFVEARTNSLVPPLPYPSDTFDFIYAFSVFTHMSVELARSWVAELERVMKPGALVWFTVHGQVYRERLSPEQQRQFDRGEVVVWFPEIEGTNLCAAYWPASAVPDMLGDGFEIVSHLDPLARPADAQAAQVAPHDAFLARRV